jgi:hypothetical protein
MLYPASQERTARIAKLHADLSRNLQTMDELGLDIAANYLDLAIARIELEVRQQWPAMTLDMLAKELFAPF